MLFCQLSPEIIDGMKSFHWIFTNTRLVKRVSVNSPLAWKWLGLTWHCSAAILGSAYFHSHQLCKMRGKEETKVKVLVSMFNLSFAFGNFLVLKSDGAHL